MAHKDPVQPAVREAVLRRDGVCFIARLLITHVCRDRFGVHASTDTSRLTVDHVHLDGAHMGKRAPSDEMHMVAMCWHANVHGCMPQLNWRDIRAEERDYLRKLYAHVAEQR